MYVYNEAVLSGYIEYNKFDSNEKENSEFPISRELFQKNIIQQKVDAKQEKFRKILFDKKWMQSKKRPLQIWMMLF